MNLSKDPEFGQMYRELVEMGVPPNQIERWNTGGGFHALVVVLAEGKNRKVKRYVAFSGPYEDVKLIAGYYYRHAGRERWVDITYTDEDVYKDGQRRGHRSRLRNALVYSMERAMELEQSKHRGGQEV